MNAGEQNLLRELDEQIISLRSPEGFLNAGRPNYEHLFGRDSCVSALQLLEQDATIARSALLVLAKLQGQRRRLHREEWPGKILHEHFPGGWRQMLQDIFNDSDKARKLIILLTWRFPYYGSVDSGAWFMILLHHYFKATGDAILVKELWPVIEGIHGWLNKHAAATRLGLVGFRSHYNLGLKNQSWKDSLRLSGTGPLAMIEVQGYYFYAYRLMAELAEEVMDAPEIKEIWQTKADRLQASFKKHFEVKTDGSVYLSVDGRGKALDVVTSNPGHLLFTGILSQHEEKLVVSRLFQPDLLTEYGIRTESALSPWFASDSYHRGSVWPFDNWVIYQGLLKTGYIKEAGRLKQGLLRAQQALGRIPELYRVEPAGHLFELPNACRVQAWSAGALVNMLTQKKAVL